MIPMLEAAKQYDRAAGFFTSESLSVLTHGLQQFARRHGRFRLVISPILTDSDLEQITEGYISRSKAVEVQVSHELERYISLEPLASRKLAWLIANDVLDIRFATPAETLQGLYHEKFGIFVMSDYKVAFTGSLNETAAALTRNIEYIDVFTSTRDAERVAEKELAFDRLWNGRAQGIVTVDFPEACKNRLISLSPGEYPMDESVPSNAPTRLIRPKQQAAIDAWFGNDSCGILAMATGTGKTFTALRIAQTVLKARARSVVVLVPQIALADQWAREIQEELDINAITCHSQADWRVQLGSALAVAQRDKSRNIVMVSTYDTAASDEFQVIVNRLPRPMLLIADEVHNVTPGLAPNVLLADYEFRLGLSATPERYLDDEGTDTLRRYFHGVVYRYTLAEAIGDETLTPYQYMPIICNMRDVSGKYRTSGMGEIANARCSKFISMFESSPGYSEGYSLIYCSPSQVPTVKRWLGIDLGLRIHTFTAMESAPERVTILKDFASQELHSLVAIRCLDEGIDVPATRSAYLLASSENPKQFVQRRGRVLRRFPGKEKALIVDFLFIKVPNSDTAQAALEAEITRFAEFASVAINSDEAVNTLRAAAKLMGIALEEFITGV